MDPATPKYVEQKFQVTYVNVQNSAELQSIIEIPTNRDPKNSLENSQTVIPKSLLNRRHVKLPIKHPIKMNDLLFNNQFNQS
jgi:hypothetical protein